MKSLILPWLCLGQPGTEHLRFRGPVLPPAFLRPPPLPPPPPPAAILELPAVPNVLTLMLSMFMWFMLMWFMSAMVAAAMAIAPLPIPAAPAAAAAEAAVGAFPPWPDRLKCAAHMPLHRLPWDCLPHPATLHRGRDCCWVLGRLPLPTVETEALSVPAVAAEYSAEAEYERPSRSCRSTSLSSISPVLLVAAAAAAAFFFFFFFFICLLWPRPAPGTSPPGWWVWYHSRKWERHMLRFRPPCDCLSHPSTAQRRRCWPVPTEPPVPVEEKELRREDDEAGAEGAAAAAAGTAAAAGAAGAAGGTGSPIPAMNACRNGWSGAPKLPAGTAPPPASGSSASSIRRGSGGSGSSSS